MTLSLFSRKSSSIKPALSRTLSGGQASPKASEPEKPQPVFRSVRSRPLSRM